MKVELIRWTPEPEDTIAAAARLCYSSADIARIVERMQADKARDPSANWRKWGTTRPLSTSALPLIEG